MPSTKNTENAIFTVLCCQATFPFSRHCFRTYFCQIWSWCPNLYERLSGNRAICSFCLESTSEADAHLKYAGCIKELGKFAKFSPLFTPSKMTTVREGYLRDLPHPNLNDVLKSNTHSAIKLLKTGRFLHFVSCKKWTLNSTSYRLVL